MSEFFTSDGSVLHYRTDGDRARPCLILSNSLGTDLSMWQAQVTALAGDFFVVRYDTRCHGQSTGAAPFGIDRLGLDVVALLDHLDIARAAFCGISMGGLTGQWLGIHQPQRLTQLVLANTAARIGSADAWLARAQQVRRDGMAAVADGAPARCSRRGFSSTRRTRWRAWSPPCATRMRAAMRLAARRWRKPTCAPRWA